MHNPHLPSCMTMLLFAADIMLNQNDIHGNELNSNLAISPTIHISEVTVNWSKNGRILDPNDSRVSISSEGVLTVTTVQASDRGVYTVTASNTARPDGVNASVNVGINCKCI